MRKTLIVLTNMLLLGGMAMAKEVTTEIKVKGMTCGSCVVSVKKALTQTKGVKSADVSLDKAQATVVYDDAQVNEQQLRDAINKTGFKAEPNKASR
ncbi:MAG: heavy metal-associated domain-containing protein [Acidobacteriota bacterium]